MYADLHIHTNNSDGLLSVKEVIYDSINKNIKVIAITDHDTIEGIKDIIEYLSIVVIPGVELTVTNKLHILGYFINPDNISLKRALEKMKLKKASWMVKLVKLLSAEYDISIKKLLDQYKEITMGSICNYLLNMTNCKLTKSQIYERYFWGNTPYIGKMPSFTIENAIRLIKEAGGIAVLAHPSLVWKSNEEFSELLSHLLSCGLDGIEVYHISNDCNEQIPYFTEIAKNNNLLITGGSDFHGTKNKYTYLGDYGISENEWIAIESYVKKKGKM